MCAVIIIFSACSVLSSAPHILEKDSKIPSLMKFRTESCVRECVYFTSHSFTVFCSGSDYYGPLPHAHVVTAAKPDPQTLGVCFTCLFSQESRILPSILPPPSVFYCLQHRAAELSGVRWGSRYKKCVCVCVRIHVDVGTLWHRQMQRLYLQYVYMLCHVCSVHIDQHLEKNIRDVNELCNTFLGSIAFLSCHVSVVGCCFYQSVCVHTWQLPTSVTMHFTVCVHWPVSSPIVTSASL